MEQVVPMDPVTREQKLQAMQALLEQRTKKLERVTYSLRNLWEKLHEEGHNKEAEIVFALGWWVLPEQPQHLYSASGYFSLWKT